MISEETRIAIDAELKRLSRENHLLHIKNNELMSRNVGLMNEVRRLQDLLTKRETVA